MDSTGAGDAGGAGRFKLSDTGRVEAFSDGVFAIAVTLLILELADPPHAPGQLAHALLAQWPAYLGYCASFAYIGVIWLNHHQLFARIRAVDRGLHASNLLLLFTTAALSFPTGVVSDALQIDADGIDARTSVVLYALVAAAMCFSWMVVYAHLRRRPLLLADPADAAYVRHGWQRSAVGVVGYLVGGALGYLVAPLLASAIFILLPIFYFFTSEGLSLPPKEVPAR